MSKTKKFLQLEKELKSFREVLGRASQEMRDKDLTNYPIFVVHQQEVELGVKIVDKEKTKSNWDIHASTLEEFTYKNLIRPEKLDEFKEVYKDPDDFFCFFVISELGAQFIFLPAVG
ncbi:MAG: hypothetical protein R3275_08800 [Saprospiraceae bacterium]|nr:hypothetical protein [Saprospiraceae bacterium]